LHKVVNLDRYTLNVMGIALFDLLTED